MQSVILLCEIEEQRLSSGAIASDILGILLTSLMVSTNTNPAQYLLFSTIQPEPRMAVKLAGIRLEPDTVFGAALLG